MKPKPVLRTLATAIALLLCTAAFAPAQAGRAALVIGNSAYKASPLTNPVNDATDIAASLKEAGFDGFYIDAEHGVFSLREIADLCMGAQACGLAALVRELWHGDPSSLARELLERLSHFGREGQLTDDRTLVVVKRISAP